ncbi:MAG: TetR/AcrR family transcriptional regulator [Acidobacteria bacterium]|nr:MAG: TetR/AcrR family transcriptional regulator [Acidobacteriota bacterium]
MASEQTRERILDAAEQLFSEQGLANTSLRAITRAAGVNPAAVHYHFGSKDGLIRELFRRRLEPVNRQRLELLERAERAAGGRPLPLETILECFLGPPLRLYSRPEHGHGRFLRTFGRLFSERSELVREVLTIQFGSIIERFLDAFARSLPDLPREEILWRLHFTVGAMAHTLGCPIGLVVISRGACDVERDVEATLARLIGFVAGGMRAPLPETVRGGHA